ncbi:MAG TPA: SusC/RagA family TonB-linked outer membrane protein [Chitinophaga sp.]|uniref:SusC/RagA family TonB-linked outer membrane protein n=1 Tax=Chitinophaga sp. TaxID=1869181 RepID=UPI002C1E6D71|nr:SusC/RagA family TonB-linked outer membrane protein [Chitinophaga sp.]HVI48528.1 SusC/RagA family TonB-linked outer membrane protein [Chitinophaga sp.]
MKLTSVILLFALHLSAASYSQSVTISGRKLSFKAVFNMIRAQTGFEFIYNPKLINSAGVIDLNIRSTPLKDALNQCFNQSDLTYEIKFNTIIVKERPIERIIIADMIAAMPPIEIKGQILDGKTGLPVAGVTIGIQGSTQGTTTDLEGKFVLALKNRGAVLIIKHIAYDPIVLTVQNNTDLTIRLQPRAIQLEGQVVTTGMYKRPKESFTGSATTISGSQLRNVSMVNALDAIRIFDPAIRMPENMQFGSDPNRLPEINLRGTNNFPQQATGKNLPGSGADFMATYNTNPNQPLLILDGFEVSLQKLYDLDINRIASFTILKDAAATSLYGSRAANGVIVVDTKQPLPGKLQVSYSGVMQVTAPDLTVYHLLNARDKLEVERLAGMYSEYSNRPERPDLDAFYKQLYANRRTAVERGVNTYWLAQPVTTGAGQRHSLYLEGGDQFVRYGLNLGFNREAGVMKNSYRNNYSIDMNLSYRFKKLLFKNVLSVNYNKSNNSKYGNFSDYTKQNQYWSPYDSSGHVVPILESYYSPSTGISKIYPNPLYNATINTINNTEYTSVSNQTMVEWNMGKGFRLSGRLGLTRQTDESNYFLPATHTSFLQEGDITKRGSYTKGHSKFFSYDAGLNLDYSLRSGKHLFFNTTSISTAQTMSEGTAVTVTGFPTDRLDQIQFGNGYPINTRPAGNAATTRRISGFTNMSYSYDNRYSADFSLSADGSSQFGADKRFAPFWSAGAGWNLSKEAWLKSAKWLNQFRIRASVGTTGSNNFPPYMGLTTYQYYTDQNYRGQVGATLIGYGNTNLQWQQTLKRNLGTDIQAFAGRFSLRFDVYKETTNSLILDINTPPSAGVTSYKENVGVLENKGYEFNATIFAIKKDNKGIYWSFFINGLHNNTYIKHISNSLKKLNEQNDKNDKGQQKSPQLRFQEGQSPNAIWAVRSKGIDPSSGKELFITKDGKLTYDWNPADKVVVGDQIPELQGNFGTNVTFKGLMLGLYFNYQYRGATYNQTLADRVENANLEYQVDERVLLGRWKQPGDQTFFKGLITEEGYTNTTPTYATSRFVQRYEYINLQSISLAYVIPEKYTRKWKLQNTRIGFIANDITRWSSITIERGLDYPFARNFTLNLSTSF